MTHSSFSQQRMTMLTGTPYRGFFGRKNKTEESKEEAKAEEASAADAKKGEEAKGAEEAAADGKSAEKSTDESATPGKEESKEQDSETTSSSESEAEKAEAKDGGEDALSAKDVKRIKALFNEQEDEIKDLEKKLKEMTAKNEATEKRLENKTSQYEQKLEEMKTDSTRLEKEIKLARIEYTKQVKENEATVVRYRKMIEDEKEFAITKFAKDLLEVRDAVRIAVEHQDIEGLKDEEDIQVVKDKYIMNMEGQQITAQVMDQVLERFKVTQYDPKGEKFDPQLHEAVFTVAQSDAENDTVEIVMQTGFKIGDRILRAAKVGIVKK